MKNDTFQAGRQFLNWMEKHYPGSAKKIIVRAKVPIATAGLAGIGPNGLSGHCTMSGYNAFVGLNGMGQFPGIPPLPTPGGAPVWGPGAVAQPTAVPQPEPAWYEKIASAAADVAKGYLSYKQQEQITDMQIERMKRDLPPVEDPGRYMAPTVKIAHDIDPTQLKRAITPGPETQNLLLIGGALIGLVLLMGMRQ